MKLLQETKKNVVINCSWYLSSFIIFLGQLNYACTIATMLVLCLRVVINRHSTGSWHSTSRHSTGTKIVEEVCNQKPVTPI